MTEKFWIKQIYYHESVETDDEWQNKFTIWQTCSDSKELFLEIKQNYLNTLSTYLKEQAVL